MSDSEMDLKSTREEMSSSEISPIAPQQQHQQQQQSVFSLTVIGEIEATANLNHTLMSEARSNLVFLLTANGVEVLNSSNGSVSRFAAGSVFPAVLSADAQHLFYGEWSMKQRSQRLCRAEVSMNGEIALASSSSSSSMQLEQGEMIYSLALHPSGSVVAAGTQRGSVILFDPTTLERREKCVVVEPSRPGIVFDLVFAGDCIIAATQSGRCVCVDLCEPEAVKWQREVPAPCTCIAAVLATSNSNSNSSSSVVVVGGFEAFHIFSALDGAVIAQIPLESAVCSARFLSPRHVIVATESSDVSVWDVELQQRVAEIKGCGDRLAVSADCSRVVVSTSRSKCVKVLHTTSSFSSAVVAASAVSASFSDSQSKALQQQQHQLQLQRDAVDTQLCSSSSLPVTPRRKKKYVF